SEAPPALARDVAEPKLRERLLDREVEERLEEPHRDERGRVHAVAGKTKNPGGHDGSRNGACDRDVDPRGRYRPASEHPGGHPRECREWCGSSLAAAATQPPSGV